MNPKGGMTMMNRSIYSNNSNFKPYDKLSFTDDFMFCKILENNPDVCEELLTLILGQEIHLVNIHKQETVQVTSDSHGVRFDVYADDDKDRIIDIEMQASHEPYIEKRSRYYQSIIDMQDLEKGDEYDELSDSYVIFICTYDPLGHDLPKYTFKNICIEDRSIILDDGTTRLFLNAASGKVELSLELAALFKYIIHREVTDPFTKKLDDLVSEARTREEWRDEYMWHKEAYETDLKRKAYAEGHEQGVAQGIDLKDRLFTLMESDGRLNEYSKSVKDKQLFDNLLIEYGLKKD
jgi:predicted transposase/invertase (TIGR01784 family)